MRLCCFVVVEVFGGGGGKGYNVLGTLGAVVEDQTVVLGSGAAVGVVELGDR